MTIHFPSMAVERNVTEYTKHPNYWILLVSGYIQMTQFYNQRKHFNKIRSHKAAVLPPNIFTITGCYEAFVIDAKHTPPYLIHAAQRDYTREYKRIYSKIKEIHDELCGCDKFKLLRRSTGIVKIESNNQYYDDHDIMYSNDFCIQCKELELMEFHLSMLSDETFNFKKEKICI